MERPAALRTPLLLLAAALAACAAPAPSAQAPCSEASVDLVVSAIILDRACEGLSPGTKAERKHALDTLLAQTRECSTQIQARGAEITAESRAAAEEMRKTGPAACNDLAARVQRARGATP